MMTRMNNSAVEQSTSSMCYEPYTGSHTKEVYDTLKALATLIARTYDSIFALVVVLGRIAPQSNNIWLNAAIGLCLIDTVLTFSAASNIRIDKHFDLKFSAGRLDLERTAPSNRDYVRMVAFNEQLLGYTGYFVTIALLLGMLSWFSQNEPLRIGLGVCACLRMPLGLYCLFWMFKDRITIAEVANHLSIADGGFVQKDSPCCGQWETIDQRYITTTRDTQVTNTSTTIINNSYSEQLGEANDLTPMGNEL